LGECRFREVRLGWVGSTIGKICFVFDFILHTAYTVDGCALTRTLPSLSLIDMICFTADAKATTAWVQGVGVEFRLIWTSLLHNVMKRVLNRTARFRRVSSSTDRYGV
jgi:hypothetical protein